MNHRFVSFRQDALEGNAEEKVKRGGRIWTIQAAAGPLPPRLIRKAKNSARAAGSSSAAISLVLAGLDQANGRVTRCCHATRSFPPRQVERLVMGRQQQLSR